jgi:hypothetical protein
MLTANAAERLLRCAETQKSRTQQPGRADGRAGRGQRTVSRGLGGFLLDAVHDVGWRAGRRQQPEPGTDEAQLHPVDIGRVFHDLVAEDSRVARLTEVRRQAADSEIPKLASQVREGIVPELPAWVGKAEGFMQVLSSARSSHNGRQATSAVLLGERADEVGCGRNANAIQFMDEVRCHTSNSR